MLGPAEPHGHTKATQHAAMGELGRMKSPVAARRQVGMHQHEGMAMEYAYMHGRCVPSHVCDAGCRHDGGRRRKRAEVT